MLDFGQQSKQESKQGDFLRPCSWSALFPAVTIAGGKSQDRKALCGRHDNLAPKPAEAALRLVEITILKQIRNP